MILVLDAVLGAVQECRAEKTVEALRRMTAPSARVRRNGNTVMVPAEKLVPGNLVLLEAGNLVPADLGWIDLEIGAVAALFAMEEYCCDPIGSLQVSSVFPYAKPAGSQAARRDK